MHSDLFFLFQFDMDDPRDFFTNPALRTRLSRFQNPWNSMFGQRKRRTSPPPAAAAAAAASATPEPQARSATDPYGDDFFHSHFDGAHWNEPRGWPPMNGARKRMQEHPERGTKGNADMFNYIPEEFRHYMPEQFGFHHRQPAQQPAAAPSKSPQPTYSQRNNSGDLRRPKFCDAGMQTDDISPSGSGGNIHETEPKVQHQQQSQSELPPRGNTPQQQQQQHGDHQPGGGFARSHADAGVGNSPNGSFASAKAYASTGSGNDGNDQRQTRSNSNSMGNVRRVPIIVEGQPSSFPKESHMPHRSPPNRQEAPHPPKRAQPPTPPTPREVPIQRPQEPQSPSVESINKIQDIQQDVLDLMFKVEQYEGGNKKDKDYKYLDEMLTRNLLKLDTIDTRGNDSIRLARKEAIKCIQASLSVLEAKGRPVSEKVEAGVEVKEEPQAKEGDNEVKAPASEEVDRSKIPIPLPPVPGQVPPPTIRDCNSDEEGDEKSP